MNPYDGNLDQSDFKTPICKINVKGSEEKFTFNNGLIYPYLKDVRVLVGYKRRVLFAEKLDSEALCSSQDFWHPSPHIKNPPSDECSKCVMQMWPSNMGFDQMKLRDKLLLQYKAKKKENAPICTSVYSPLMINGDGMVFIMSLLGANFTAFKNLVWSPLVSMCGELPKFIVKFDLYTEKKTNGSLDWYEVRPDNFVLDKESFESIKSIADIQINSQKMLGDEYLRQDEEKLEVKKLSAPVEINSIEPPDDVPAPNSEDDYKKSKLPF